jgi:hypothetical protein
MCPQLMHVHALRLLLSYTLALFCGDLWSEDASELIQNRHHGLPGSPSSFLLFRAASSTAKATVVDEADAADAAAAARKAGNLSLMGSCTMPEVGSDAVAEPWELASSLASSASPDSVDRALKRRFNFNTNFLGASDGTTRSLTTTLGLREGRWVALGLAGLLVVGKAAAFGLGGAGFGKGGGRAPRRDTASI